MPEPCQTLTDGEEAVRRKAQGCAPKRTLTKGPGRGRVREISMVPTFESYDKVISVIERHKGSTISVPELSQLLGVKATTLNAKFRRERTPVSTIGRTNYIRGELALILAELHKHALIGWPTLHEASKLTAVKSGTIKARCEKGRLEGHIDLTKRLRVNPAELETLRVDRHEARAKESKIFSENEPRQSPVAKPVQPVQRKQENGHCHAAPPAPKPFDLPPAPEPKIEIITGRNYGLPERDNQFDANRAMAQAPGRREKKRGCLSYDPDRPCSISECSVGKTIKYDNYDGTIVKLIKDPYNPSIMVKFPGHDSPLMREVLLRVEKGVGKR